MKNFIIINFFILINNVQDYENDRYVRDEYKR